METYSLLREFADSWVLLAMTAFFVGIIFWAFRPGSRKTHRESAEIPFRHENRPARKVNDTSRKSGEPKLEAE